ncbi:histidine kinase, partial [Cereibacter changlensis JA139]
MSMVNLIDVPAALPVAAYATDGEGFISSYNLQAAQLWGREHTPRSQKWFGAWRMRDAGGRILAPDQTPLAVAFREGWEISQADVILERPNGHRAWVRVHARLKLEAGKVVSSLVLLIERSPTIEDEFQREHLASIVASSQDVIVGKTMDGVITSWNGGATRTLGYDAEEMIGQPITRIIPTERLAEEAE